VKHSTGRVDPAILPGIVRIAALNSFIPGFPS
jgi:hypothetical protein